eukprot:GILI01000641.1.p1 GENE.GILI01000641.1~~GILI01000641.1.p1  ORF type:complete len:167 (-),score=65.35 GILI01000641.1:652-1152(-)
MSVLSSSVLSPGGVPDVRSKLKGVSEKRSSSDLADGKVENSFFRRLFAEKSAENVSFFDISSSKGNAGADFKCFLEHSTGRFFIEAPASLAASRSSIINVLEFAEDVGAKQVFIAVEKDHRQYQEVTRAFMYVGFELMDARAQKRVTPVSNTTIMVYNVEETAETA